ncbi:VOC family protein [Brachybacterium sp. AOP3-A1-3]|uniref:VOC family protein n=1 Tax=Brachybacterium sp. AOP3-A1-3 TaxID=3457699 RepID=UPI0040338016
MDTTTDPTPPTRVFVAFQARDALAEIRFLCDVLGFAQNLVVPGEGDTIAHAQLDWPGGGAVMLGNHRPDAEYQREPGTSGTYLVLDDPDLDALLARAQSEGSGARIVQALRERDHGGRELTLADPEGNLWSIGTYPGEPSAADS